MRYLLYLGDDFVVVRLLLGSEVQVAASYLLVVAEKSIMKASPGSTQTHT